MKDEENHIDYDLLGKYLSGDANDEEVKIIEAWKASSQDNNAEFQRLAKLWMEAESLIGIKPAPVDTDAAWENLHGRLFGEEDISETGPEQPKTDTQPLHKEIKTGSEEKETIDKPALKEPKTRSLYFYATRVAAVVVMGFIIYAIFFMGGGIPDQVEVIAENSVTVTDLPDDSKITLNENSKITYPEKFKEKERKVELSGEAFFEVKPSEKKPFVVHAHNAVVKVLGTTFNVRAIESESEVSVTVEEGKVRLSDEEDVVFVLLERNEKGVFNRDTGHIEKYERAEGSEMFWRSRTIMFRDTKLSTVFSTLERLYEAEIIIKNEDILSCKLSGKFQDENIDEILDRIAVIFNLTILKNNNTFEISGDGC
jgi:ferric-dicitrate binding protein FerR (iron transport regulator)